MLKEFKDLVLYPCYIDLTHFCTHFKAYSALELLISWGNKITETTDKTSSLSILLNQEEIDQGRVNLVVN